MAIVVQHNVEMELMNTLQKSESTVKARGFVWSCQTLMMTKRLGM